MTTAQLEQARLMISNGDVASFYSYMTAQGFNYPILANGLVSGTSFSGEAAISFLFDSAQNQGVVFKESQLPAFEEDMANKWVNALEDVAGLSGTVSADLTYQQTLAFHTAAFADFGLGPQTWTLYAPGQVLSPAYMESSWQTMLTQMATPVVGPAASEGQLTLDMLEAASNSQNPQSAQLATNWILTNALNVPSDFVDLFKNATSSAAAVEPDGSTTYTNGAGITLTQYSYSTPNLNDGTTFTTTENVWDIPVETPAISVQQLDDGVVVNASSNANAIVSPQGSLQVTGANVRAVAPNSATQPGNVLSFNGSNNTFDFSGAVNASIVGSNNVFSVAAGASLAVSSPSSATPVANIVADQQGNVTIDFAGGSVLMGPNAQAISQTANGLAVAPGPSGTAEISLESDNSSDSPIVFTGLESLALNSDGTYSAIDQSGDAYSLTPVSGSSAYALSNASGTMNLTIDSSSISTIQLGQNISVGTIAGGEITVPVFGGSGTLDLGNLGSTTIAQGADVTVGSNTISISSPGSGTTTEYTFASGGAVSSIASYDDSSAQSSPRTVVSFNSAGDETQVLTNNADGTSQIVVFNASNPSADFITQVQNFSGAGGTGALISQTTDLQDGLSEVDSFSPSSGVTAVKNLYSGLDGTGSEISQINDFTDGSSSVTTFQTADLQAAGLTEETVTYSGADGTGLVQSTTYTFESGVTSTDAALGETLGSTIGKFLGDNNVVADIGLSTVLGTLGEEVGKAVNVQAADGLATGDMSETIGSLAGTALPDLEINGAGAIAAYLTGELVNDLGLKGLPAQIVDTGAGYAISTIASNLVSEANGVAGVTWATGLTLADFGDAFAGFAGAEIVNMGVDWQTPMEEDLAAVGATIGEFLGSELGPLGSFVGSMAGDVLGALVGLTFSHYDEPESYGAIYVNESSSSPFWYAPGYSQGGESPEFVNSAGALIATELNAIAADVGGVISNPASSNITLQVGTEGWVANGRGVGDETHANTFVDDTVFNELSTIQFSGGDVYVERAIDATLLERSQMISSVDYSVYANSSPLATLLGNIQVAKDYEKYLANENTINQLIADSPTSNFSAAWIVELAQANALGLNVAATGLTQSGSFTLKYYGQSVSSSFSGYLQTLIDEDLQWKITDAASLQALFHTDGTMYVAGSGLTATASDSNLLMAFNGDHNKVAINGNGNNVSLNGSVNIYSTIGNAGQVIANGNYNTLSVFGDGEQIAANGLSDDITVSGQSDSANTGNSNILVGDGSSLTVNGTSDTIDAQNNTFIAVNGGSMTIDINGNSNHLTANGDNEAIAFDGNNNAVVANGAGDNISVMGTGGALTAGSSTVTVGELAEVNINGENLGVSLGYDSTVTISGQYIGTTLSNNGDNVTLNGNSLGLSGNSDSSTATVNGSNDSIDVTGAHNAFTVNGNANYVTSSGDDDALTANGSQIIATIEGENDLVTIAYGTVNIVDSSTVDVNGYQNAVQVGNSTKVTVSGGAMTLNIDGSGDTATQNGDDSSLIVNGASNELTANGNNETVLVNGNYDDLTLNGIGDGVTLNGMYGAVSGQFSQSAVTMNGTGNSMVITGSANSLTENGNYDYFTVNGDNDGLNANGQGITAQISGVNDTISIAAGSVSFSDNAQATVDGESDSVDIRDTSQLTVNGGSMALAVNGTSDTVIANGNDNTFHENGSSSLFVANGSSDTFVSGGDFNNVTLNGNDEVVSIEGADNLIAVNGQNNQITLSGTNNTLHAGGASAFVLDSSTADFEGGGDSITVYNGDTVTANGSGFVITETATNSSVVANGDYNVATIGGNHNAVTLNGNAGQVELSGSVNTVTVSGQNATLDVSGVQQVLAVNQGSIDVHAGSDAGLAGNGNLVTLDASDTLTLNGSNNWVNAATNDSITLMGTGNGIGGDATGVTAILEGDGQFAILSDDAITVGTGIQASVRGDGNSIGVGAGSTLDLTGSDNSVHTTGATLNLTDSVSATTGNSPETGSSASGFAVNGFDFTSYNAGQFSSAAGAQSLQSLADTGANSVSLVVTQYVQNVTDTNIEPTSATESDASLELAISEAQADGLSVTLKPHLDVSDGTWRAYLDPSNVAQFFSNYQAMIVHYADIAQATGVGTLVIGTEMESLSGTAYEPYWDTLIAAVRQVYSGQLTYASGWNETANVSFWNKLDIIGADAYIPVTDITDPTVQQLETGWTTESNNSYDASVMDNMAPVDFYKSLSTDYDKPVLFTEIGYQSVNDTNELEGAFGTSNWVDFQQQSKALQAFFSTFSQNGGNWFDGAYLWNWEANPAGVETGDFSVQGKPGLNIVDYWYGLKSGTQSGSAMPNTLTGDSNSVSVGAGDALDVVGGGNQITLGAGAGVSVSGTGNQVNVTAGNNIIQTTGSTTINLSGSGTTAMIAGDGDAVSANGAGDGIAITGDNVQVSLLGNGSALTVSGNNSTVSVTGDNDTVSITGDQSTITVTGTAAAIQVSGSTNVVLGGGTDAVSLGSGTGNVALGSGNDTITLQDSDIVTANTAAGDSSNASSAVITESGSVQPQSNELAFSSANSDQLWFSRSGNDLLISVIGTSSEIDISGWYNASSSAVQSFEAADGKMLTSNDVNALVSAMASFNPPAAGSTTLPETYQSQLQPVIAANWH
jgi:hypothetical protein